MAEIKAVISALDSLSGEYGDIASELRHIGSGISGAKLGAGFDISAKHQINNTLERISESVGRSARTVSQMSDTLRTASQAYKNTENKLSGNHVNGSGYSHGGNSGLAFFSGITAAAPYIWDVVSSFFEDTVKDPKTGKLVPNGNGIVNKVFGGIFSFCSSFGSNFAEFDGDFSNSRFWNETVLEAGIDILKGLAIGAAVTAVIGSGGLAVALTGVVISWLTSDIIDAATNIVTGTDKGFNETISDAILNEAEKVRGPDVSGAW